MHELGQQGTRCGERIRTTMRDDGHEWAAGLLMRLHGARAHQRRLASWMRWTWPCSGGTGRLAWPKQFSFVVLNAAEQQLCPLY